MNIYDELENLKVRALLLGADEKRIDEVLQIVSLTGTGKKKAGQLQMLQLPGEMREGS